MRRVSVLVCAAALLSSPLAAQVNPVSHSGGTITPLADHPSLNLVAERVVVGLQGSATAYGRLPNFGFVVPHAPSPTTQVTATLEFHNEGDACTVDMAFPVVTHPTPDGAPDFHVEGMRVDVDGQQQETVALDGEVELGGERRPCDWHIFAVQFGANQRRVLQAQYEQRSAAAGHVRVPYVLATGGGWKGAVRPITLEARFGPGVYGRDLQLTGDGAPLTVELRQGALVWEAADYDGTPEVLRFMALVTGGPASPPTPTAPVGGRQWGPEQATGPPDTPRAGDIPTAWATREQNAGIQWLKLDYEQAVTIGEVRVRETYNPGAVSKVAAVLENGTETVLWEGQDPTTNAPGDFVAQVERDIEAKSIKVYLDTTRKNGWNEIDAVELVGKDGTRQWAKSATASTFYGDGGAPVLAPGAGVAEVIWTLPQGAGGPGLGPFAPPPPATPEPQPRPEREPPTRPRLP
ncbi:MAG: hypothetical protein PVH68_13600 [Armatimonadota bacterium]|jgi:hypothetical protein